MKRNGNNHAGRNEEKILTAALEAAIHEVFEENEIGLLQMQSVAYAGGPIEPPLANHVYAIGESVIMIGSHLADPRQQSKALKLEEQIAARTALLLGLGMEDQRIQLEIDMHNGMYRARMARFTPRVITWKEIAKQAGNAFALGRDQESIGQLVTANPLEWVPGAKITGAARIAGKSNLMRLIAAQAAAKGWLVYLACMKGSDGWEDLVPCAAGGVAWNNDDGLRMLQSLREEVYARNAKTRPKFPHILLVWDEASILVTSEQNQDVLAELASVAGSAHFVMLVGVQNLGENVSKGVHRNLTTTFVGKTADASASYTNSAINRLGAHRLTGKGHFFYVENNGTVHEIQVPRADSEQQRIDALAKQYDCSREQILCMVDNEQIPGSAIRSDIADLVIKGKEQAAKLRTPSRSGTRIQREPAQARLAAKTLSTFYDEMIKHERETDRRRKPPTLNVVAKTYVYLWRTGVLPTIEQVQFWNQAVEGNKTMSRRRINVALKTAERFYAYVNGLIRNEGFERKNVGSSFAAETRKNAPSGEAFIPYRRILADRDTILVIYAKARKE